MSDLPIVAEVTPPPDVVVEVTPLPDIVAEVSAIYAPPAAARALSPVFVYDPSGTAGKNVYTSWALLVADLAATEGPKIVQFVYSVSIPAGAWDLNGATLSGLDAFGSWVVVTCGDGVTLAGFGGVVARDGIMLLSTRTTGAVWSPSTATQYMFEDNAVVVSTDAAFINPVHTSGVMVFGFTNLSGFAKSSDLSLGFTDYESLLYNGAGVVSLVDFTGAPLLFDDTVRGSGTIARSRYSPSRNPYSTAADGDTQTNAASWSSNLGAVSSLVGYDNAVSGLTATNVKAAVDELAAGVAGKVAKAMFPVCETIAISDETTALTTGTAKVTWRAPYAFTLTAVRAQLNTASSSGTPTFDINEAGTSVLSTLLTIDSGELTSVTAATPAVISDSAIADDAILTFDIDAAGTGAKGAKIVLYGTRSV